MATLTIADLRTVLADNNLGFFSFPYLTVKRPMLKVLRPFAKAGLISMLQMPARGYCGARELRVVMTESAAREVFGEDSNQFRTHAWIMSIEGAKVA